MESDRRNKIKLISRLNRRTAAVPLFMADLSRALHLDVEASALASVEKSDSLLAIFKKQYEASQKSDAIRYRNFFGPSGSEVVYRLARCFGESLAGESAFLLTKIAEDTEAILLGASSVLVNTEAVIELDKDSICLISIDDSQGLLVDRNMDDPVEAFEVAVWGERWTLVMLECVHRVIAG